MDCDQEIYEITSVCHNFHLWAATVQSDHLETAQLASGQADAVTGAEGGWGWTQVSRGVLIRMSCAHWEGWGGGVTAPAVPSLHRSAERTGGGGGGGGGVICCTLVPPQEQRLQFMSVNQMCYCGKGGGWAGLLANSAGLELDSVPSSSRRDCEHPFPLLMSGSG